MPRLCQHIERNGDLAEIVQQSPEGELQKLLLREVQQHADESRKNGDIDRMGKCVSVMQPDVRKLYEIFSLRDEVEQDGFRNALQRLGIEGSVFCNFLKNMCDIVYGGDARLFLHDVLRRQEL